MKEYIYWLESMYTMRDHKKHFFAVFLNKKR